VFAKFAELVAREQLMVSCSKELKLWIKEQKPKTVDEMTQVHALVLYCHYTRYLVVLQLYHYYCHQQYVHAEFVYISQTYLVYVHSLLASLALKDNS
jgi:hypothetical protein